MEVSSIDTCQTVNRLSLGEAEMIEYAYDVADALGIEYGPVHGEYIIDEDGPVLIEVNCRPCGGNMPAEFLDRISGQHETDSILDSYLKPLRFAEKRKQRYHLLAHGAIKFFIVPKDIKATSVPMNIICSKLKSYYSTNLEHITENQRFFMKTEDLETSCGFVFMVHKDLDVVKDEINFLRSVEKHAFSLVLSDKYEQVCEIDEDEIISEMRKIIEITQMYGTGLLITDQIIEDVELVQCSLKDFHKVNGEFDYVIINLNKSLVDKRDDVCVDIILNILLTTKVGALVCIPESTYQYVPSNRKGVEALIETLDLKIEARIHGINTGILASKENF